MVRRRAAGAALLALAGTGWAAPTHAAVAVDPSSTSLLLSITESAYGQSVTASATVTTAPGPPRGDIVFAVDDLLIKANLGASGTATIVLPRLLAGQHPVIATFVPQFPAAQQGSTSPTEVLVVSPVRTRLQVRVTGRGVRVPTKVQVTAAGDYGTRPTGRVKVVAREVGTRRSIRVVTRLGATSFAVAGLGKLAAGAYRLRVTYVGDSQHQRRSQVETFRVPRG